MILLPDVAQIEYYIHTLVLLATPHFQARSLLPTKINLKVEDYVYQEKTVKELDFPTKADDFKLPNGKMTANLGKLVDNRAREGKETPLIIFTQDLKCNTRSKIFGVAVM